jgi:hypothetical protein
LLLAGTGDRYVGTGNIAERNVAQSRSARRSGLCGATYHFDQRLSPRAICSVIVMPGNDVARHHAIASTEVRRKSARNPEAQYATATLSQGGLKAPDKLQPGTAANDGNTGTRSNARLEGKPGHRDAARLSHAIQSNPRIYTASPGSP